MRLMSLFSLASCSLIHMLAIASNSQIDLFYAYVLLRGTITTLYNAHRNNVYNRIMIAETVLAVLWMMTRFDLLVESGGALLSALVVYQFGKLLRRHFDDI